MGTFPIKNKLMFIANYEEKIAYATALIQSAAEHVKGRDEAGQLYAASLDVDKRIGKEMEVRATERRRRKKNRSN